MCACLAALLLLAPALRADPFTFTWLASFDNGFTLADGSTPLPLGNEIRFGTFGNFSDSAIAYLIETNNLLALAQHFTLLDTATIGEALPGSLLASKPLAARTGHFEATFEADPDLVGANGKTAAYWVFRTANNAPVNSTYSNVLEVGVFYLASASWVIPSGSDPVPALAVDITDLTNSAGTALFPTAHLVAGRFVPGASGSSSNFALHFIPEPSLAALLGSAVMLLGFWRPRKWRRSD